MSPAGVESVSRAGRWLKRSCLSMGLLTAALLVGSLGNNAVFGGAFYTSPILLVPGLLFTVLLLICLVRLRPTKAALGFYLGHGGLVLILAGALLGWGYGEDVTFHIPVDPTVSFGEVQIDSGEPLEFGFQISVPEFRVEYTGDTVSQYHAGLRIIDGGETEVRAMKVNSPVTHRGWKFYLMDYDHEAQSYVSLHAKHDPGNRVFAAGLWAVIIGTAMMCFQIGPGKTVSAGAAENGKAVPNESA